MAVAAVKEDLRRRMRTERASLAASEHAARSLRAQERFASLERFAESRSVGLYAPIRGEVSTELLFERARTNGKAVLFPKLLDHDPIGIAYFPVDALAELEPGRYGISEPSGEGSPVPPEQIDLVAVPGVAFDSRGGRLGYGGGYFDRLLGRGEGRPRWAAGIAFDFQVVERVPMEPGDVPVDQVVTERRTLPSQGD